jgi:two-component system response regulator HydG
LQIERHLKFKQEKFESQAWRNTYNRDLEKYRIIGESKFSKILRSQIEKLAPNDISILIEGETGVGKELVARNIHLRSNRAMGPFVAIDCGAVPKTLAESIFFGHEKGTFTSAETNAEGLFFQANGGTLFLDELSSLSLRLQSKLLRALEEREVRPVGSRKSVKVDVRILAAANEDLLSKVKEGQFRSDLYYRIAALKLLVQPLRSRGEDISILAAKFAAPKRISAKAIKFLEDYHWPGNIRELQNCIKAAGVLSGSEVEILPEHIPPAFDKNEDAETAPLEELNWHKYMKDAEFHFLRAVYKISGGNVSKCARMVGLDRVNLFQKLKRSGIHKVR